jgi:hypothetical protein
MDFRLIASKQATYAACGAVALLIAGAARSQTINAISGTPAQGGTVVISGSSFGTKPIAAPVVYDDFDSGVAGNPISTAAGWNEVGYSGTQIPRYDSAVKHAGTNSMKLYWDNWQSACSVRKNGDFSREFYLDGWFQYDQEDGPPYSRVVKLMLLFGSGALEYPQIHFGTSNCTQNESFHIGGYADETTQTSMVYGVRLGDLIGRFRHIQLWIRASDSGQHNGAIRLWLDGQLIASSDAYLTVADNQGFWNHVRLGYYHAHDGIPGLCDPSPGDAYGWWDNVYIDNTQARVELGNAATYDACTLREIQVPASWSESAVTVNFKQGAFTAGQSAYLFVVSANGTKSPGFPVTIGGTAPSGPGQPGKPVF